MKYLELKALLIVALILLGYSFGLRHGKNMANDLQGAIIEETKTGIIRDMAQSHYLSEEHKYQFMLAVKRYGLPANVRDTVDVLFLAKQVDTVEVIFSETTLSVEQAIDSIRKVLKDKDVEYLTFDSDSTEPSPMSHPADNESLRRWMRNKSDETARKVDEKFNVDWGDN